MSYENRSEDVLAIRDLRFGQSYYFNEIQGGSALVKLPLDSLGWYELFSIPLYGGENIFERFIDPDKIEEAVDEVYDEWT